MLHTLNKRRPAVTRRRVAFVGQFVHRRNRVMRRTEICSGGAVVIGALMLVALSTLMEICGFLSFPAVITVIRIGYGGQKFAL
jgi:hypothetical protein